MEFIEVVVEAYVMENEAQFPHIMDNFCLVLLQVHKLFCASPNFLCRTKNLFTYCASHKHFVPDKKMICIQ